ncbi:MAG: hypothetical protein RJA70_3880 [Pseudomonadota bacterium]|jgi:NADH-quinone oxidoreductase subunit J
MVPLQQILFWVFSLVMLTTAVLAITRKNLVNSAMLVIQVFLCMGGIFLLLQAFFLAVVQVLVYAGAVVVLFLFVIMLLSPEDEKSAISNGAVLRALIVFPLLLGALAAAALAAEPSASLPQALAATSSGGGLVEVMRSLFSRHILAFELTALILLSAMVGVVVLSKQEAK